MKKTSTLTKHDATSIPANFRIPALLSFSLAFLVTACGDSSVQFDDDVEAKEVEQAAVAAAASPLGTAVKYHPGHYYHLPTQNPGAILQNGEFENTKALRGAQIRYAWRQLEPTKDNYQFDIIEQNLATLQAKGERLIIMIQTKSFRPEDDDVVPAYMKNATYDGGQFAYSFKSGGATKGYNVALWNQNVRSRFEKLISKLGARFNHELYFEGVGLVESAIGYPVGNPPSYSSDKFYDNLLSLNKSMRTAFPNTVTFQFINYPRPILENFIVGGSGLKSFGGGLGGPDVWLEDPGVNVSNGVYAYYDKVSHKIPLLPSVMPGNYANTRHDGTGFQPSVPQLFAFARDNLHANYLFWTRISKAGEPGHYTKVLELLNKPAQANSDSGGLDATCPSTYPSCYRQ